MTKEWMLRGMRKLQDVYDKQYTEGQIKVWGEFFCNWELDTFNNAIDFCIKNCRFLPTIADMYIFLKKEDEGFVSNDPLYPLKEE